MTGAVQQSAELGDTGVLVALIMGLASIAGTAVAGWYTYISARKNATATREIEEQKASTASWVAQVEAWRTDVVALRQQRAEDRAEYEQHRQDCAGRIARLHERVNRMADEKEDLRGEVQALREWGAVVIRIMNEHGTVFPPPPPGV